MDKAFYAAEGHGTDRNQDPIKWDKAFDSFLERRFKSFPSYLDLDIPDDVHRGLMSQSSLSSLEGERKSTCTLQYDLAELVAAKREEDFFDSKWVSMSPETRQDHLLKALVVCCNVPDMEDRRFWCPETTLEFLQRNSGQGFLTLLDKFCPRDETSITLKDQPILLSHPDFDKFMHIGEPLPPGERGTLLSVCQRHALFSRSYFLAFFLWNTMLQVYDIPQVYIPTKLQYRPEKSSARDEHIPEAFQNMAKDARKEVRKQHKRAQRSCAACDKMEEHLPEGTRFLQCTKCSAVGRKVTYCDRACQLKDWKTGSPPHKQICGKSFELPTGALNITPAVTTAPPNDRRNEDSEFPEPDPGFIRPPELIHQMALLRENPSLSYVLVRPAPEPDHGIMLQDPAGAMFFHIMRTRAMKNGDPNAVATMLQFLEGFARSVRISRARVIAQLSREYGISTKKLTALCDEKVDSKVPQRVDKTADKAPDGFKLNPELQMVD
ncbi:hypothetical protein FRB99_008879 [Tulasnella sp. 403]|nr:hypothetical protein FRB99_008879 [Tulasnella sp. 403]